MAIDLRVNDVVLHSSARLAMLTMFLPLPTMSLLPLIIMVIQVRVVQKTDTGKIYAMKTLRKSEMFKKDQVGDSLYRIESR